MSKILSLSLLLTATLLAQTPAPQEPYPGQREHHAPPEGWFCSRDAQDRAHFCICSGMQPNNDPLCKKEPTEPVPIDPDDPDAGTFVPVPPEDPQCTVWCHRSHCHCKQFCDT